MESADTSINLLSEFKANAVNSLEKVEKFSIFIWKPFGAYVSSTVTPIISLFSKNFSPFRNQYRCRNYVQLCCRDYFHFLLS
jgi:hypothetical protein